MHILRLSLALFGDSRVSKAMICSSGGHLGEQQRGAMCLTRPLYRCKQSEEGFCSIENRAVIDGCTLIGRMSLFIGKPEVVR